MFNFLKKSDSLPNNIICPDESLSKGTGYYSLSPCEPERFRSLLTQLNSSGTLCEKTYQTLQQQVSNCNPKCKINKNLEIKYRDWETLNSEYNKCQDERGAKKDKQNKKFEKKYPSEWMQKKQMDMEQLKREEQIADNNRVRENEDIRNDFNRVRDTGTYEEQISYGNNLLNAKKYISDQSPEAKWNMGPDKKDENKILELGGKRKSLKKKTKKRKSRKGRKSRSKKGSSKKTRRRL